MRIVAKRHDGQLVVLSKSDLAWERLDAALKIAIQLWSPPTYQANLDDLEYWDLFSDFMIKFKLIELPFWHLHSVLSFLHSGSFLVRAPSLSQSQKKVRVLFKNLLSERYPEDDPFFDFIDDFSNAAEKTRKFRNKIVHQPWATQDKRIGICGIKDGDITFNEITKRELWENMSKIYDISLVLTHLFFGFSFGFSDKYSNVSFEGFCYYPPLD